MRKKIYQTQILPNPGLKKLALLKASLAFILVTATSVGLYAGTIEGEIFEKDSNLSKKLFTFSAEETNLNGLTQVQTTFKDLAGSVVLVESGTISGEQLTEFKIDQKQINTQASLKVVDGKVNFEKTADGQTKKSDEKHRLPLVISTNFQRHIRSQWEQLLAGKTIEFRYASWARMETVGFEIFKTGEEKLNGEDVVVLKMKPSSFLIAALVKPLVLKFSKEKKHLVMLSGRVAPMKKNGSKFEDLDADVVYKYN